MRRVLSTGAANSKLMYIPWPKPLVPGTLVRRRNRFLLDVELKTGKCVVAYCANPGRMESLVIPRSRIWLSERSGEAGSLRWVWELVETSGGLIATNSAIGNRLARAVIEGRLLCGLKRFERLNSEIKISKSSRIDFELQSRNSKHFVEVKGAHLIYPDGSAYLPDSLTVRSPRHLRELIALRKKGQKATLLIVVPGGRACRVRPSDLHDPDFSRILRRAAEVGVSVRAILANPTLKGIAFVREIPVDLKPYSLVEIERWKTENDGFAGWQT